MNGFYCKNENIGSQYSITYPPFSEQELHVHDQCELFYLAKGIGYYETEGTRYKFTPGMILLMGPGESHRAVRFDGSPYARLSIHFNPSVIDSFDKDRLLLRPFYDRTMGTRNYYSPEMLENTNIYQYFEKMSTHCGSQKAQCIQVLSYLPAVLSELSKIFDQNIAPSIDQNNLIHDILDYINRNLSTPLSVELLCDKFFITRSQLYRLFKKTTKINTWEYIVLKRLVLARSMINDGIASIDAAKACGFKDYSSFYRAYIAKYGEPPSGIHRTRGK